MNNLTLFLLGLVLIYTPACLSAGEKCFSQNLNPSYPCCTGNKVVYTDKNGNWGVENDKWCGIDNDSSDSCFSLPMGYPCCTGNKVVFTDKNGNWGVENGEWCGIDSDSSDSCFSLPMGYPCCTSCKVSYIDKDGKWGIENGKWCGLKDSCNSDIVNPVQGDTDFEFAFLKLENNKKNMLYSPLSIKYALSMLKEGAAGKTFDEINNLVGNDDLPKYSSIDKNLSLANGLFIRDTFYEYVKEKYINILKEEYNAEVIKDEFENAENANKWIEDKTLGIIKNMLKDDVVQDPYSVMLLINALAIDMEWDYKFFTENTSGKTFYKDNGEKMLATMMSKEEIHGKYLSYYKDDDITVFTMDLKEYDETQFEFIAIMPKEDLSTFVKNVSIDQINQIDKKLILSSDEKYGVNLKVPKFKFSYDLSLKDDLKDLGINDAFTEKADFSEIADPKQQLYVSDALHKADIEFTEKGVKAAAVTVIIMSKNGITIPKESYPVEITIDKPFMFVIRDKKTKDIWFTGTVYEPNSWEKDKESYKPIY